MSEQFSNISLYIPHIFPNFTKEDVKEIFENQKIGKVSNVDFVSKMGRDGKPYNAAYVHFEFWCDNISNRNFQSRVCDPNKEARIVYDEPWHWIVLENKARKYAPGERKPCIDLSSLNPAASKPAKVVDNSWPALPSKPVAKPTLAANDADFLELIEDLAQCEYDEEDTEFKQFINEMDECVDAMEEDDRHLASVDTRYLQALEEENAYFRSEMQLVNIRIMELSNSLYNEQVKANTLAEALRMVSIKN
jgi:hypothetical protein